MNQQDETISLLREIRDLLTRQVEQSRTALEKQAEAVDRQRSFTRVYYGAVGLFLALVGVVIVLVMRLIG